jgi:hypothetical protein
VFIKDREYGSSSKFDPFSFKERKGKVDDETFPNNAINKGIKNYRS